MILNIIQFLYTFGSFFKNIHMNTLNILYEIFSNNLMVAVGIRILCNIFQ